jgi:hypothetical protein
MAENAVVEKQKSATKTERKGEGLACSVLAWLGGKRSRRSGGQDGRGPRTAVKSTGRLF